ncbi:piggyBac transposable element-derived protein 3-like [Mercenaria mercenaria]|uniref:piggyBac transposable element-derived protein 3-like n=1 Tax=Mercenaria mercenaria TaxID=6596 RepID=UPI00234E8913|nr:piggyBac transposable element-derived protein 3-like [Mercenaria mercenaria]
MYWNNDTDVRNNAIINAMTRDSFDTLIQYIHLFDNANLDQDDKFSKVRPLLSLLNERFLLYFPKQQNLSIDESMIPYYGRKRHGAKQFIRGKQIRFGYKMWALTTPLGYLLQFKQYQRARGLQAADTKRLGMGEAVVMDLLVSKKTMHII